jgi:hypothetical protein
MVLAVVLLLALLTAAAMVVGHQHHLAPVSGPPGTIDVFRAALAA